MRQAVYTVERRAGRIIITCACGTRSAPLSARRALDVAHAVDDPLARFTFGKCRSVRGNMRTEWSRLARMLRAAAWLLRRVGD